ncbi:hypothetical protein Hanom_Chr03g00182901 [Helianthus anomalus]
MFDLLIPVFDCMLFLSIWGCWCFKISECVSSSHMQVHSFLIYRFC